MRGLASPPRLPRLKGPPKAPTGSRFVPKIAVTLTGYGEPPPGFITGQNSLTEWIFYWSLFKIFGQTTDDPRQPPFYGLSPYFEYQSAQLGGFTRALGSAVVDFVIFHGGTVLGVRIQTERFHLFTSSRQQASDALQLANLEANGLRVIDVYDTELLGDPTGAKAIIAAKRAIGMIERQNPLIAGTQYRASRIRAVR
jgi:hypothetical protein